MVVVVGARDTVTVTAGLVDVALFVSPEYVAVMLCAPTFNVDTEIEAPPAETFAVPRIVPPSLNVIVPVTDAGDTDALSVVEAPNASAVGVAATVVEVGNRPTDTVVAALVAAVSFISPL
jgi:hypothetical protein